MSRHRARALSFVPAVALLAACNGSPRDSPSHDPPGAAAAAPGDAAGPDANLDACRVAAAQVPALPPAARMQALLDRCQPCGDWQPLLAWSTLQQAGGPTRAAIADAMVRCRAFCEPNAKQRFLGTLDRARGQGTRLPWRLLGEICKAQVSAVPDARYMDAPYFALDRIARALGEPALLAAIVLPLPAITLTGNGFELPDAPAMAGPAPIISVGGPALSLDAVQLVLGTLPSARLSPAGVEVSGDYPGTPILPAALAAALAAPALAGQPVALLAPNALRASRVAEAVAAAAGHEVRLAVGAAGPAGWTLPAALPIALVAARATPKTADPGSPGIRLVLGAIADAAIAAAQAAPPAALRAQVVTIAIDDGATVAGLGHVLAALGALGVTSAALVVTSGALVVPAAPPHVTKRRAPKP